MMGSVDMKDNISVKDFKEIKKQLGDIWHEYSLLDEKSEDPEIKKQKAELLYEYIFAENRLSNYNLSMIPFEDWEGVTLVGEEEQYIDFSSSMANIDFELVKYLGFCNFTNCNLRHFNNLDDTLKSKSITNDNIDKMIDDIVDNIDDHKDLFNDNLLLNDVTGIKKLNVDLNKKLYIVIKHKPELVKYLLKSGLAKSFGYNFRSKSSYDNLFTTRDDIFLKNLDNFIDYYFNNYFLRNIASLKNYDSSLFSLSNDQTKVINWLGLENIKRFEIETGFFSYYFGNMEQLWMLNRLVHYVEGNSGVFDTIKDMSYEGFYEKIAMFLRDELSTGNAHHDFITGDFREKYPDLFIDENAPEKLKDAFYSHSITSAFLYQHEDYIDYIVDKDLESLIADKIQIVQELVDEDDVCTFSYESFIKQYANKYGNKAMLEMFVKYGSFMSDLSFYIKGKKEDYKQLLDNVLSENALIDAIYEKIVNGPVIYYTDLAKNSLFVERHPDIFLDNDCDEYYVDFYNRSFPFEAIRSNPSLIDVLKNKRIDIIFDDSFNVFEGVKSFYKSMIKSFGNEACLKLISKYGKDFIRIINDIFVDNIYANINNQTFEVPQYDALDSMMEKIYIDLCLDGRITYGLNAPDCLKHHHPELFLDDDAPKELKDALYYPNGGLTFRLLSEHRDWLKYLKGKNIIPSMIAQNPRFREYFAQFRNEKEKGLLLGINRMKIVMRMIDDGREALMKDWYDKTGQKFIPEVVVMRDFPLCEADKFLASGGNWSKLSRLREFSEYEAKDAMLKLAYTFGAFDADQKGFKKVFDLLQSLPHKLPASAEHVFESIDTEFIVPEGTKLRESFKESPQDMINYIKKQKDDNLYEGIADPSEIAELLEYVVSEKVPIDCRKYHIMSQLYKKEADGTYTLIINQQKYPKFCELMKIIMGRFNDLPIISAKKAHQLFGGFILKYDPYFREFLLNNLNAIINDYENVKYLANIQRQFDQIRVVNSNRRLTWELAVSFVKSNKYLDIEPGNDMVAEVASIAGYRQDDFEVLQKIYDYGKQRVFNSIPRISNTFKNYSYEILRLDDPLALVIGTLSDCCQQLGDVAEVCMEHSMVDKNGRVFVVRDEQGNIVAQSWVWRNKDTICFDNIEIPDRAFKRYNDNDEVSLTEKIFDAYKSAAIEMILEDEKVYRQLFDAGKITQDQYERLRVGKITVGLGYNDIASEIKRKARLDNEVLSKPLSSKMPVNLSRNLYTRDSNTQYVLEERDDRISYDGETIAANADDYVLEESNEGETLAAHSDDYIIYDDNNFTIKMYYMLKRLALFSDSKSRFEYVDLDGMFDENRIVSELAVNYGADPERMKIIMNANFAMIYEQVDDELKIYDLFFNTNYELNEEVVIKKDEIYKNVTLQIRLALEQLGVSGIVDMSLLDEYQTKMVKGAINIRDELDVERGINNAK